MDDLNVVNTIDSNHENDSDSSENNEMNTILNELCKYSENVFQNMMVCSSITLISVLCFSLLFILFLSLIFLF